MVSALGSRPDKHTHTLDGDTAIIVKERVSDLPLLRDAGHRGSRGLCRLSLSRPSACNGVKNQQCERSDEGRLTIALSIHDQPQYTSATRVWDCIMGGKEEMNEERTGKVVVFVSKNEI